MNLEGVRVLLVEDNPADARFLREEIADVGAGAVKLKHVTRLEQALKVLETEDFDVVLLDLSLPDAAGIDTLVRAHAKAPAVPIVVLTGIDDEALAVRAVREGAQDYLVKGQTDGNLLVRSMRYATERKHAIEALQRREEHFRSLIENALDLISIISEDGTIRYVSPSHERVLGYGADELVQVNLLQFIHPSDVDGLMARFAPMARPSPWKRACAIERFLARSGIVRTRPFANPRSAGHRHQFARRHGAQDSRGGGARGNILLRAVIRTSPLAIYSTCLAGLVKSWNAAAQRMFGAGVGLARNRCRACWRPTRSDSATTWSRSAADSPMRPSRRAARRATIACWTSISGALRCATGPVR